MAKKEVYFFGAGKADGRADMKNLLGGKGANLAEMCRLGIPVPAGFTITTEVCTQYYKNKAKFSAELTTAVKKALARVEAIMKKKFGDPANPLLVSVRSGARRSMPGMMETVLNIGLTSQTIPGLIALTKNERFVYDAYRRLITMYADVVMEKAAGIEPADGHGVRHHLEQVMDAMKRAKGITEDTQLSADDLKALCAQYKEIVKQVLGSEFPDDAEKQLWGGIRAVFQSWNGKRAVAYRRIERIPDEWGTAVNVQAMVFGNTGDRSATGVAFTRDPATGENVFYGEWLVNAQGEDVVAGIRTPYPLNKATKSEQSMHLPSLEEAMPTLYKQLDDIRTTLEKHYKDMQDLEFTIEDGTLWMLQCRVGKRTGAAAIRMAVEMCESRLIDKRTAIMRVSPDQLDELLHPMLDPAAEKSATKLAKGLPAGPGGGVGQIVLTADDADEWAKQGKKVILVRNETSPEDVHGMHVAQAILTAKGGMTSHAALVARGWGKCCIVGCGALKIDVASKTVTVDGKVLREGDWISMNGTKGIVYEGQVAVMAADPDANPWYKKLMKWVDEVREINVRTNADTPKDAENAVRFGAEGIGLFRTEHMFYGEGSDRPLFLLRKMIMSKTKEERVAALNQLSDYVKQDIKATLEVMNGMPVTIRLLDPPLHEFVPHSPDKIAELAAELGVNSEELEKRAHDLRESNPMLGHRGVRLGITYPEITEMQVRAILEASGELIKEGKKANPEIMVPVTCAASELDDQKKIVNQVYADVCAKLGLKRIPYVYGTMIEIPRAALTADKMAATSEFFSFGTNDLTQMGFGFSRDDIGAFLPEYLDKKLLPDDPFQVLDQEGVGQLVQMGVERGRATRPDLKVGICGEHGGDPSSVMFCHRVGMNYVSCSPFRVPIARFAAAQAAIQWPRKPVAAKKKPAARKKPAAKKRSAR